MALTDVNVVVKIEEMSPADAQKRGRPFETARGLLFGGHNRMVLDVLRNALAVRLGAEFDGTFRVVSVEVQDNCPFGYVVVGGGHRASLVNVLCFNPDEPEEPCFRVPSTNGQRMFSHDEVDGLESRIGGGDPTTGA